jgi:hypothetical protein
MGKLGVKQVFTDEKNMEIIAEKFKADPDATLKQVKFLVVCWKGQHDIRAKLYRECVESWLGIDHEKHWEKIFGHMGIDNDRINRMQMLIQNFPILLSDGKFVNKTEYTKAVIKTLCDIHDKSIQLRKFKPQNASEQKIWDLMWSTEKATENAISLLEGSIKKLTQTSQ